MLPLQYNFCRAAAIVAHPVMKRRFFPNNMLLWGSQLPTALAVRLMLFNEPPHALFMPCPTCLRRFKQTIRAHHLIMFFSSFTSFSNAWGARRGPEGGLMVIYKIWADQLNGLFHLYPHVRVFQFQPSFKSNAPRDIRPKRSIQLAYSPGLKISTTPVPPKIGPLRL